MAMETNWAAEHLQVIRTLMERSAVYRRALAPMMLLAGCIGIGGAVAGLTLRLVAPRDFLIFWMSLAAATLIGAFLLVRRQALKAAEPFWSLPTRRITQAVLPPLTAGALLSLAALGNPSPETITRVPLAWAILYGCALHAAGFFMPRGIKLFGWAFVIGGCLLVLVKIGGFSRSDFAHGIMGVFFGLFHLLYGVYLYFTEKRRNEL